MPRPARSCATGNRRLLPNSAGVIRLWVALAARRVTLAGMDFPGGVMRGLFAFLKAGLAVALMALAVPVAKGQEMQVGTEAGLQDWITGFRARALAAGISSATFETAMADVHFRPDVVERDRKQDELPRRFGIIWTKACWVTASPGGQKALKQHGPL